MKNKQNNFYTNNYRADSYNDFSANGGGGQYSQQQQFPQYQQYSQQQFPQYQQYNQVNPSFDANASFSQMRAEVNLSMMQMQEQHRQEINKILEFGRDKVTELKQDNKLLSQKVEALEDGHKQIYAKQRESEKYYKAELAKRDGEIKRLRDIIEDKNESKRLKKTKIDDSDQAVNFEGDAKSVDSNKNTSKGCFSSKVKKNTINDQPKRGSKDLKRMQELFNNKRVNSLGR